jgi:hypothetical protein
MEKSRELQELEGKYVQRDIEDQISEEYKEKGLIYNRTHMSKTIPVIDPKEILDLIKSGYSRFKKDDEGFGSIQEKYNLSDSDVKRLFRHPLLRFKKTSIPGFVFADEQPQQTQSPTLVVTNAESVSTTATTVTSAVTESTDNLFI